MSDGNQEGLNAAYKEMGCRVSLIVHFLHSNVDLFPESLCEVSDEQGERFHQDVKSMAHRCQGLRKESIMTDYCCVLYRDAPDSVPQKEEVITFLTFTFSRTDDVVCDMI